VSATILEGVEEELALKVQLDEKAAVAQSLEQLPFEATVTVQDDLLPPEAELPTLDQVREVVAEIAADPAYVFDFIAWGCEFRAHKMAVDLEEAGIPHGKAFALGTLGAKNEVMEVTWRHHVAPLVYAVDHDGQVQALVIDPGVSDEPLTLEAWIDLLSDGAVTLEVTVRDQYDPVRSRFGRQRFEDNDDFQDDTTRQKKYLDEFLATGGDIPATSRFRSVKWVGER
jgi:hypothetical protein